MESRSPTSRAKLLPGNTRCRKSRQRLSWTQLPSRQPNRTSIGIFRHSDRNGEPKPNKPRETSPRQHALPEVATAAELDATAKPPAKSDKYRHIPAFRSEWRAEAQQAARNFSQATRAAGSRDSG